jgi:xanthine dehydrogenase YagR molybdenum-binding subunit
MRDGEWLIGWGCASEVYPTHIGASTGRVKLNSDSRAHVQIAAHEIGIGVMTVVGQIASEHLGIPLDQVQVELGDSRLPPVPVAGGSNQTASGCSVVAQACDALMAGLNSAGGNSIEAKFEKLGVSTLEEYAKFIPEEAKPNPVTELFSNPIKKLRAGVPTLVGGSQGKKNLYAVGAEFVEVCVHARTRKVRVPRLVGAFAAGRIMNRAPRTASSWAR